MFENVFLGRLNHSNEDWSRPLTDEEIEFNRITAQLMASITKEIESATPIHPVTGETGEFNDYVPTGGGLKARYVTPSGVSFFRRK